MTTLTYDEYVELGGKADNNSFAYLLPDADSKLNYFTFGRLHKLEEIPCTVKILLTKYIDFMNTNSSALSRDKSLTGYSNGIESFQFNGANQETVNSRYLYDLCTQYLIDYPELIYRGRK